jgi:hypothetical protein
LTQSCAYVPGPTRSSPSRRLRQARTGLKGDAATIADLLKTSHGPIVLVKHSYRGAVLTNAAHRIHNVKALVYIDAFAPAKGENLLALDVSPRSGTCRGPGQRIQFRAVSGLEEGRRRAIRKACGLRARFRERAHARRGVVFAATQSPALYSALTAPSGPPAWKSIPSWYLLGTIDKAISPAVELFMAERLHAHIPRLHAGHLSMVADLPRPCS